MGSVTDLGLDKERKQTESILKLVTWHEHSQECDCEIYFWMFL
jgi:hypothetical protein